MTRPDLATVLRALEACDEALSWAAPFGARWEDALEACRDRRWLTWLAGALLRRGHLRREVLVLCACACARLALRHVPAGQDCAQRAIETAERWARGQATSDDVRAARDAAYAAAACAARYSRAVAYAYAAAAYAAAAAAAADGAAAAAADGAADAADAAAAAADAALLATVRRELGPALLDGLDAYAAAAEATP